MTDVTNDNSGYDVDVAIRILDETQRAANWIEANAQIIEKMMMDDPKLANKIEAYILAKRVNDTLEDARKLLGAVVQKGAYGIIPEKMVDEGCTTFNSATGYRVTCTTRLSASIIKENQSAAFDWLRENDLGDIIVEQVNAQTLSAQARRLIEEENMDLPEDLFKVSTAANTSVTKIKK